MHEGIVTCGEGGKGGRPPRRAAPARARPERGEVDATRHEGRLGPTENVRGLSSPQPDLAREIIRDEVPRGADERLRRRPALPARNRYSMLPIQRKSVPGAS